MEDIKFYEVNPEYINYLLPIAPHLFKNKENDQINNRKFIGIILEINGIKYFAPLSSFKQKHLKMKENLDFIKIKNYAVINLNNMFPIPDGQYYYVDISKEKNIKYRNLLISEYRFIKSIQDKIRKNAKILYNHKRKYGSSTPLAKRCNDFSLLEKACIEYRTE